MFGIVQYFSGEDDQGQKCGYCQGPGTSFSKGMWAYVLSPQNYQDMIDRGWRRSGKYCYKPSMEKTCCPQYTIRCDALSFKPSKSQKKVLKKMHRFLLKGADDAGNDDPDEAGGSATGKPDGDSLQESRDTLNGDCRAAMEPDMSGCGAGRVNQDIGPDTRISHSLPEEPSPMSTDQSSAPVKSTEAAEQPRKTGNVEQSKNAGVKKKELRRQRWAEKRKAANLPTEKPDSQQKNREKTLDDWLNFPEGKHKLEIRLVRTAPYSPEAKASDEASLQVYTLYQMKVHDYTKEKCARSKWAQFLVDSPLSPIQDPPLGSFHHQYWLDDQLIAVGVLDILPSCVSSVYFYYNPDYAFLSLGTFSSLCEIKLTRDLNRQLPTLKYYYLGFYIHSCPKMRYKGRLPTSELLCPEAYTWHPIARCLPLIEANKYSRLESNKKLEDPLRPPSITQTSVLFNQTGMTASQYMRRKRVGREELDEIKEYCDLVGSKLMKELYLLREPSD